VSDPPSELYSLLIPLQQERLLVPRMCVAEVIAFAEPEREDVDGELPDWFLGTVEWNNRRLPVLTFESHIVISDAKKKRGRTRIVVVHAIGDVLKGGFYGIVTQGFPQLVRVNPDVLSRDLERGWAEDQPVLCRARMIHEYPLIPDLEELERRVAELDLGN
jgi:chemosensory pili system protein ChpC